MISISPVDLAAKLQSIRNLERGPSLAEELSSEPRLTELLWFLQYMSIQPGGLSAFSEAFIVCFQDRFEPVRRVRTYIDHEDLDLDLGVGYRSEVSSPKECVQAARAHLPGALTDLCIDESAGLSGRWYCPKLIRFLLEMLDIHRDKTLNKIAETTVTREMFPLLEFSRKRCSPVVIVGPQKVGKSTALKAFCESRPGLARLVTVPPASRERDFVTAHADAFGIAYTASTSPADIRGKVEYVMKHSGLFTAYDKANLLIEGTRTRVTSSRRLSWVASRVLDQHLGCSFVATTQEYNSLERYSKTTGDSLPRPIKLPDGLSVDDLMAVTEKKFPSVNKGLRMAICGYAVESADPLMDIVKVVEYASCRAEERKSPTVALEDVEAAVRMFMPGCLETCVAAPLQPVCGAAARRVPGVRGPLERDTIHQAAERRSSPAELGSSRRDLTTIFSG
jgi:hypothetical protein